MIAMVCDFVFIFSAKELSQLTDPFHLPSCTSMTATSSNNATTKKGGNQHPQPQQDFE